MKKGLLFICSKCGEEFDDGDCGRSIQQPVCPNCGGHGDWSGEMEIEDEDSYREKDG